MLRYKGETFNMVDCEGVSHKVVQVTSIKAKKAYEDGKPVWMHPCNMRVNNMWQNPMPTSKKRIETITLTPKEEQKIEDVISLLTTIKGTYQDIFRKNGEIWCTGSYPSCIDRLADVAWRVSMVRTTYGGSSVINDYPCPKMPFADFSEE